MTIPRPVRGCRGWRAAAQALRWSAAAGAVLVPPAALAQGMATAAPALGMAVPLSVPGMADGAASRLPAPVAGGRPPPDRGSAAAAPGRRRPHGLGSGSADAPGRLPDQRTGARHEHVVHDICIGC